MDMVEGICGCIMEDRHVFTDDNEVMKDISYSPGHWRDVKSRRVSAFITRDIILVVTVVTTTTHGAVQMSQRATGLLGLVHEIPTWLNPLNSNPSGWHG